MNQIIGILIPLIVLTVLFLRAIGKYNAQEMKRIALLVFSVYLVGNLYFTLLSRTIGSGAFVELKPFHVYTRLFEKTIESGVATSGFAEKYLEGISPFAGLILNILLYYPLGYLLPIIFPKLKPKHIILIGCLCSIATEATQYILKMGWCETDDVIHNTLGTAIGVWIWHLQSKRLNKPKSNEPTKD